jgi:hypothetical protein
MSLVRRRPLAGIAALGAVALIAGCGGGSDSLSAEEFRTQADAICADYNSQAANLTDPTQPSEYLASLQEIIPLQKSQLDKLKDLEPPSELSGTFDEALALLERQSGVLDTAVERLEGGDDPETVLTEIATEASSIGDEADTKAEELGLKVCGTDGTGDTSGGTATAPATTATPATIETAPATTGAATGTDAYVADVQAAAGALSEFGNVLSTSTGIEDLKSKVPGARESLDTFDASIAKLDGYSLGIPRLDEQREGLAATGPKVSDVLRRFLDAAASGDLAAVQALVPEVTSTIGEFQAAATGS